MERKLLKGSCGLTNKKKKERDLPSGILSFSLTNFVFFDIIKKMKKKVRNLMKPYFYVSTPNLTVPRLCFTTKKRAELVERLLPVLTKTSLQFVQNAVDDFEIPLSEHSKIRLGSDNKLNLVGVVAFETQIDTDTILKLNKSGLKFRLSGGFYLITLHPSRKFDILESFELLFKYREAVD